MNLDYLTSFYSKKHSEESIIKGVNSLLSSHENLQAKIFPCYIQKTFLENSLYWQKECKLLSKSDRIFLFEYSRKTKSKNAPELICGKFFIISNEKYENVYSILTLDDSAFFTKGILSYFRNSYPIVSLTFITHKRLQSLLTSFRDINHFIDFRIVRTSMKSRVDKKVFPTVNWPEFTLEKAFDWIKDENGWFESLTFETRKETTPNFRVSISREGIVKTNKFFDLIYNDFITPIAKTVYENATFFGRRARLENNGEIKPLCIDFGYNHFDTIEENSRFIEAMKKMKASSVSVIHGNPYVQLSIFDYYDGSSYDIWVLSEDRIIIVPQLKSTFQAVKRLINHVFDNYYEGDIQEYSYSHG